MSLTENKFTVGVTCAAISVPIAVYVYKFIKNNFLTYEEFGQKIVPLNITPENVKDGYNDRPYMPFRYPYHQTMSLVKLDMNYWSIIDHQYFRFQNEKKRLLNDYDPIKLKDNLFFKKDDKYIEIFEELMELVVNHFTHRFPKLFEKKGDLVTNKLMNETYNIKTMDPLLVVTKISMEDYFVVTKDAETGSYICVGVSVCFGGGGFPITPIVGTNLDDVHKPVPYYETSLKKSMNKWFARFKDPVERASCHIVWDDELNCSELYSKYRELNEKDYRDYISTIPFEKFSVRAERQSLVKLPKSEAIIFTNHPTFINIAEDTKDEGNVPEIILKMLYDIPEDIIKYKHFEAIRDTIAPYLEDMVEDQIKRGLVKRGGKLRTIDSFPFAGWMNDPNAWTATRGYVKPVIMR